MHGLGFPGSGHRTASFPDQRSVVSFSDVALQPARKLNSLLGLVSMTRLSLSRRRPSNPGFCSQSCGQTEPIRQRLKSDCGGKTQKQYPNTIINSFHLSHVKRTFRGNVCDLLVSVKIFLLKCSDPNRLFQSGTPSQHDAFWTHDACAFFCP